MFGGGGTWFVLTPWREDLCVYGVKSPSFGNNKEKRDGALCDRVTKYSIAYSAFSKRKLELWKVPLFTTNWPYISVTIIS